MNVFLERMNRISEMPEGSLEKFTKLYEFVEEAPEGKKGTWEYIACMMGTNNTKELNHFRYFVIAKGMEKVDKTHERVQEVGKMLLGEKALNELNKKNSRNIVLSPEKARLKEMDKMIKEACLVADWDRVDYLSEEILKIDVDEEEEKEF